MTLRRALRVSLPESDDSPAVTGAQAQALLQLAHAGPMSMGALARALGITFPAATDLVTRLEAAGKVERIFSRDDRRKVLVELTPSARALAEGVLEERRKRVASVLDELPEPERTGLVRGLQLLAQALSTSAGMWIAEAPWWFRETSAFVTAL